MSAISAISFDFFDTLAHHEGPGRGARLMDYLRANGWDSAQWEHQILYDVFGIHGAEYDPDANLSRHLEFCRAFSTTLFRRMDVRAPRAAAADHALRIWRMLGPESLVLFPDVRPALTGLRAAGYPLVIVSNWQWGLGAFCRKLGLGDVVNHVIASAEVGSAKPDARIFAEACRRLGVGAEHVLHVGDSVADDYDGARGAGLEAVLLTREPNVSRIEAARAISGLANIAELASQMRTTR